MEVLVRLDCETAVESFDDVLGGGSGGTEEVIVFRLGRQVWGQFELEGMAGPTRSSS